MRYIAPRSDSSENMLLDWWEFSQPCRDVERRIKVFCFIFWCKYSIVVRIYVLLVIRKIRLEYILFTYNIEKLRNLIFLKVRKKLYFLESEWEKKFLSKVNAVCGFHSFVRSYCTNTCIFYRRVENPSENKKTNLLRGRPRDFVSF